MVDRLSLRRYAVVLLCLLFPVSLSGRCTPEMLDLKPPIIDSVTYSYDVDDEGFTILFEVEAHDEDHAVGRIEISVDDEALEPCPGSPCKREYAYPPGSFPEGKLDYMVRACDTAGPCRGRGTSVSIPHIAWPMIDVTYSPREPTSGDPVALLVEASDDRGFEEIAIEVDGEQADRRTSRYKPLGGRYKLSSHTFTGGPYDPGVVVFDVTVCDSGRLCSSRLEMGPFRCGFDDLCRTVSAEVPIKARTGQVVTEEVEEEWIACPLPVESGATVRLGVARGLSGPITTEEDGQILGGLIGEFEYFCSGVEVELTVYDVAELSPVILAIHSGEIDVLCCLDYDDPQVMRVLEEVGILQTFLPLDEFLEAAHVDRRGFTYDGSTYGLFKNWGTPGAFSVGAFTPYPREGAALAIFVTSP